ncbi:ester cyclase [Streptomyces canus]|uniref:ester cyclase n=1 Tax=Streptomyces canus TaxID=58343 RepID=UPI0033F8DDE0
MHRLVAPRDVRSRELARLLLDWAVVARELEVAAHPGPACGGRPHQAGGQCGDDPPGAFIHALFTRGDLSAVDVYLAEDFVNHDPPVGVSPDREGMRAAGALFRQGFPDWHSDLGFLVGEGELVVEQFTASGTQQGEAMGVVGDGRTVVLKGINIFRVRGGRIVERWGRLDDLGLARQLGLVPTPTSA